MVLAVALIAAVLSVPFLLSLPVEFVGATGEKARSQIRRHLPIESDLPDVESASGKCYSQIDSSARWFQITLQPEAAEEWQRVLHGRLEKGSPSDEDGEGVHRTVTTPIPTESDLGKAPKWWSPPALETRLTERKRWTGHYADSVYTMFDPTTNRLWIYKASQQHAVLWPRGSVPDGIQFKLGRTAAP